jgi:streptogrisin C
VHDSLLSRGYRSVATGLDIQNGGRIKASVARQPGMPTSAADILSGIPQAVRGQTDITVADEPVAVPEEAFGGMRVRDGGVDRCTSGWSVINEQEVTGVTTGGHCSGIDQIVHPGHAVHGTRYVRQHLGAWGDVEWHHTDVVNNISFYANEHAEIRRVRHVEPRPSIAIGEDVCLYGRSSNRRACTNVADVSTSCTDSAVTVDRLVLMDGDVGTGGDSGGTWSFASRAYGAHYGNCLFDPTREAFSVADLHDEALGVRVLSLNRLVGQQTLTPGASLVSQDGRFSCSRRPTATW